MPGGVVVGVIMDVGQAGQAREEDACVLCLCVIGSKPICPLICVPGKVKRPA